MATTKLSANFEELRSLRQGGRLVFLLGLVSCGGTLFLPVDTIPPAVPLVARSSPATSAGNDSTPTFSVSLTGGGRFALGDSITLHEGADCAGANVGTAVSGQTGTSAAVTRASAMSEGAVDFHAKVTDASGNSSCTAVPATYTYDHTPPLVTATRVRTNALASQPILFGVSVDGAASHALSATDVTLNPTGTVSCSTKSVAPLAAGSYSVIVHGCSGQGTLGVTLAAAIATDAVGNGSATVVSTSTNVIGETGAFTYTPATAPALATAIATTTDNNAMETADFNGDGKVDIVLAVKTGGAKVLLNNGNGRYTAANASPKGSATGTRGVIVGDWNQDGDLDLVLVNDLGTRSQIWTNSMGGTTWTAGALLESCTISTSTQTAAMKGAAGNLNGDTDLDLVIVNENQGSCVYFGAAGSTFVSKTGAASATASDYSLDAANRSSQDIAIADVDGDGDLDALIANREAETDRVCRNNGTGVYTCADLALNGAPEVLCDQSIALGDLDGDSCTDLAFGGRQSVTTGCTVGDNGGRTRFALQNKSGGLCLGTYGAAALVPNTNATDLIYDVRLADLNADGRLDLVLGNRAGQDSVHKWDPATSNFTTFVSAAADAFGPSTGGFTWSYGIAAADFDGDGLKDIASAFNNSNGGITDSVLYYFGTRSEVHTSQLAKNGANAANASAKYSETPSTALTAFGSGSVANLSGLTYDPVRAKYYHVRNNDLKILESDVAFANVREIALTGFTAGTGFDGDLEGIVYLGQFGGVSKYALNDEIGNIYVGTLPTVGVNTVDKSAFTTLTYDAALGSASNKNLGAEGIAYDPASRTFWVVREGSSTFNRSIYSFRINAALTALSDISNWVWNTPVDLSDIAYNLQTNTLFLLSHESGRVYELTRGGHLLGQHSLVGNGGTVAQFEGLAFGPNFELVLTSENSAAGTAGVGSYTVYNRQ